MCEISKVSHGADMCKRRHRHVSHWKDYEEVELQQKAVVWQWKSTEARMIVKVNTVAMDTLPSTELHCVWVEESGVFLLKSKQHQTPLDKSFINLTWTLFFTCFYWSFNFSFCLFFSSPLLCSIFFFKNPFVLGWDTFLCNFNTAHSNSFLFPILLRLCCPLKAVKINILRCNHQGHQETEYSQYSVDGNGKPNTQQIYRQTPYGTFTSTGHLEFKPFVVALDYG